MNFYFCCLVLMYLLQATMSRAFSKTHICVANMTDIFYTCTCSFQRIPKCSHSRMSKFHYIIHNIELHCSRKINPQFVDYAWGYRYSFTCWSFFAIQGPRMWRFVVLETIVNVCCFPFGVFSVLFQLKNKSWNMLVITC